MIEALPFAYGGPPLQGRLRAQPTDFAVDEILGFEPSGEGEHAYVQIEKIDANTEWVAHRLAEFAGTGPMAVSYAGQKDRHAITRQTYSIHLPGRVDPDWSTLDVPGVSVISSTRHARKLKRGAHRGNRFRIVLRDVVGDRELAEQRLQNIAGGGVPNYFGEQRFGRDGDNLELARQLFSGRRMPRHQRGFALSAARSFLFNTILGERVRDGTWNTALDGDVWMLAGTHAIFGPTPWEDMLAQRLANLDIHPTGALWGRGPLRSADAVAALESSIVDGHSDLADGLASAGLDQERRSLRLLVDQFSHQWENNALTVEFCLESGAFATTVLRELCDWREHPVAT
ncbi:MAG: tRNA pseudouridine(13) synthase TruD [Dokdonella sp.]